MRLMSLQREQQIGFGEHEKDAIGVRAQLDSGDHGLLPAVRDVNCQ